MFIFVNALKNIIRNKKHYIICGVFLVLTLSVYSCGIFYFNFFADILERVN